MIVQKLKHILVQSLTGLALLFLGASAFINEMWCFNQAYFHDYLGVAQHFVWMISSLALAFAVPVKILGWHNTP